MMINIQQVSRAGIGGLFGSTLIIYMDLQEIKKTHISQRLFPSDKFLDQVRNKYYLTKVILYTITGIVTPVLALRSNINIPPYISVLLGASIPSLIKTSASALGPISPRSIDY